MRDPLDLLGDLPDFPGKTPPKNRIDSPKKKGPSLGEARGKVYKINGEDVEMFTIGELCKAIGRKPVTVRMWESRGWIPRANFRTPAPKGAQVPGKAVKGRRLYTRIQVEFLVEAVESFPLEDQSPATWNAFRAHIKANWPK